MVYHTCRLYRSLGYKSTFKHVIQPVVRMATYKTRLQSEKEIQRMLEEIGSEGDDDFYQKVTKVQKVKVTVTEIGRRSSRKIRIK